jgi:hypothetical protein
MFELKKRKGTFFGDLGIESYSDLSPRAKGYEDALVKLGFVENEYFEFVSYSGLYKEGSTKDFRYLRPHSIVLKQGKYEGLEFYLKQWDDNVSIILFRHAPTLETRPFSFDFEILFANLERELDNLYTHLASLPNIVIGKTIPDFPYEFVEERFDAYEKYVYRCLRSYKYFDFDRVEVGKRFYGACIEWSRY